MQRRKLRYNRKLKARARDLRNNSTLAEILLWNQLKRGQLLGLDFHRQRPIGNYIVDFYCPELQLVIEIDGTSHNDNQREDAMRELELEAMGLTVLRFLDSDVKKNLQGVLCKIELLAETFPR